MASAEDSETLEDLLARLRDAPVDNSGADEVVLGRLFTYLMEVPTDPSTGLLHWFCTLANSTTVAAATFLIRLFAYNSPAVNQWKSKLLSCLTGCSGCVQRFEEAKVSSKTTYFSPFAENILQEFYLNFEAWELDGILESLDKTSSTRRTLSDDPPATLYRIVSNMTFFKDSRIQSIIRDFPPSHPPSGWPTDPLPPGMLILLLNDNVAVQEWAHCQAARCATVPMSSDAFLGSPKVVLDTVAAAMNSSGLESLGSSSFVSPMDTATSYSFSKDPEKLWSGFRAILRLLPLELLTANEHHQVDVRRIVTSHLHDTGPQFPVVLQCLCLLIQRMGNRFWVGEGPEYPQVVFDAVKDNPSYLSQLQGLEPSTEKPQPLLWFEEFLQSVDKGAIFQELLAKMADFLCSELQHERFYDARPLIMAFATGLFSRFLRHREDTSHQHFAASSVLDIHAEALVGVAFSSVYADAKWQTARSSARELITTALGHDLANLNAVITQMCQRYSEEQDEVLLPLMKIRQQIWKRTYEFLPAPSETAGIAAIISVVAESAHLDSLNKKVFIKAFEISKSPVQPGPTVEQVNASLSIIQKGFPDALTNWTNYNTSSSALDVLLRPGVVKNIVALMFSPIESTQLATQALVGLAFDVDGRSDCFRALLENQAQAALQGISESLVAFIKYATVVPEARSQSKTLVRCFQDIIEILCLGPNGLLHNALFLQNDTSDSIPKLWKIMVSTITIIFKRTPIWSSYFEAEEMTDWMRDALIFCRDLLTQRTTFETAANSRASLTLSVAAERLSEVGKRMVHDLQGVLPELTRWLRLTDEELLHQSFALLESLLDCFRETGIMPSPSGIAKLTKHINDARKNDPTRPKTRLDATRLSRLEACLASFEDDEIQIVSHTSSKSRGSVAKADTKTALLASFDRKSDPRKLAVKAPPAASASSRTSRFFSDSDQQKLEAATSSSSFRKPNQMPAAGPSKRILGQPQRRMPVGKNEGMAEAIPTEESSSSAEDSEEEGLQSRHLTELSRFQRSPKIRKPVQRRQVKTMEVPLAKANPMEERLRRQNEARRVATSNKPDLSGLYNTLLSWDYDHEGAEPPGEKLSLTKIPDSFSDHKHYQAVFEPLLLLECWSQIAQSKEATTDSHECAVVSRRFVDKWLDLEMSIKGSVSSDWYLTETDVILLSDGNKRLLGKTQSYQGNEGKVFVRLVIPPNQGDSPQINSHWRLSKTFSLSTLNREYAALVSLPCYDFCERVLKPQPSRSVEMDAKEVQNIMDKCGLNSPQAVAISSSLKIDGFGLIQGPPGTGKTSTICGLITTFLSKRPRPIPAVNGAKMTCSVDTGPSFKVLLCAPSNAAIDEVAHRINRAGLRVVRMGADKAINNAVKDISLDSLVQLKLDAFQKQTTASGQEASALQNSLESIKAIIMEKEKEVLTIVNNDTRRLALEEEIKRLKSQRWTVTGEATRAKDKRRDDFRALDAARRKFRVDVLQECDVICCTLSGAGHEILQQFDFGVVIIDEAAQAIELSSLIPLRYGCSRCILVGDPQQLPPTVISREASSHGYNESLFVRLQRRDPSAVHLLSIQYRMHPDISRLPSHLFYEDRLRDGPDMEKNTTQLWHSHPKFGTYRFFDITRGKEEQSGQSIKNMAECQVAVALFARLRQEFAGVKLDSRVGVVSMYRAQIVELRRQFRERFGQEILNKVDFNTVDGFQGQEKDVIILSCVRAGPGLQSVGFLSDIRRMNVALTRAKSSLFVLGNASTLERSDVTWRNIIQDARTRSCLVNVDTNYFTAPNTQVRLPSPKKQKQLPPASLPEPANVLTTPQEIKAAIGGGSSSQNRKQVVGKSAVPTEVPVPSSTGEQTNLKRKMDADGPAQPPPSAVQDTGEGKSLKRKMDAEDRPRLPPPPPQPRVKRPKDPVKSMFIPKPGKNKRP